LFNDAKSPAAMAAACSTAANSKYIILPKAGKAKSKIRSFYINIYNL
jgi:hypothetical protein